MWFWGSFSARIGLHMDETIHEFDSLVMHSLITLYKPHNTGSPYTFLLFAQTAAILRHAAYILAVRVTYYYCMSTQPSYCFRHFGIYITSKLLVMSETVGTTDLRSHMSTVDAIQTLKQNYPTAV